MFISIVILYHNKFAHMNSFIVLIWFLSMYMIIIYVNYISLYGHCWGSSALYMRFFLALIGLIFLYDYIYIIFDIVPYWLRSQFICAKSIILILSANDTCSRLWFGILNYASNLKNYDRYTGARKLLWELR